MSKSIKRALSLLLALTMVLSLGLPAYAVGAPEDDAVVVTEEPVELPEQEPVEEPVKQFGNLPIGAGKQPGIIEEDEIISEDLIVDIVDEETVVEEEAAPAKDFVYSESATGFTVEVSAPAGALPLGTEMFVNRLVDLSAVQTAVDNAEDLNGEVQLAADISFWLEGKEIEPAEGAKLVVRMSAPEIQRIAAPIVIHIPDGENAVPEIVEQLSSGDIAMADSVSFETGSFSVYAVIDDNTGDEARATVNFYGKDTTTPIATFYVKNSDILLAEGETRDPSKSYINDIVYDPGAGTLAAKEIFRGWTIGDPNYTKETEAKDIDDVRAYLASLSIKEGDVVNIYAMIYKTITISYLGDNNVSLGSETLLLLASETSATYTVNMSYTPPSSYQNFEGWNVTAGGSNIQGHTELTIYENGTVITVSGDVTFSVSAPLGHWLVFDEVEKGATYVAPQFVKQGEKTKEPTVSMQLSGYSFGGWYEDEAYTTEFTFGNQLSDNKTIYAKWDPHETANYTVIIWKQNVNDAKDAADSAKKYDFAESVTLSGAVGSTVNTVTDNGGTGNGKYAIVNNVNKQYPGFHLNRFDTDVTIDTRGNTVVNVYYDRNLVTLTFRYRQGGSWQTQATMTGLYGSTLASNGYTWPTNRWWYDSYSQGQGPGPGGYSGAGTRTTFLDAFKLSNDGDSQTFYGFDGNGNNTVHFLKKNASGGYTETNTVNTSNGTFYISDKYNGYKAVSYSTNNSTWTALGNKDSNGYYASVSDYSNLYIRYDPLVYNILYKDGVYVDGNNNPVEGYSNRGQLNVVENVPYESDTTSYNKDGANYYAPTFSGFVFGGWYIDDQCTRAYTFDTMPEGITVYAKWIMTQYRVFLHPNALNPNGEKDTTLSWGKKEDGTEVDQAMNFRISLGGKVSAPTGLRSEYEMVGWYLDPEFTQIFNADAYVLNDTTVTTPYNKETDFTDPMDKWGILGSNPYNSDLTGWDDDGDETTPGKDRFWITKKLDLYAKWRATLPGAQGIGVIYDAVDGSNAPNDTYLYKDTAGAIAQAASTAPEGKQFLHWVVQTWNEEQNQYVDTDVTVYPGDTFIVLKANAKTVITAYVKDEEGNDTDEIESATYTVQLRAEYGDAETAKDTYIDWFKNDKDPSALLYTDEELQINQAVKIYTLDSEIPTNFGYEFLGWARKPEYASFDNEGKPVGEKISYYENLGVNDLYLRWVEATDDVAAHYEAKDANGNWVTVTKVAADESMPYQAFYAVWDAKYFYVYHSGVEGGNVETHKLEEAKDGFDLTKTDLTANTLYGGYYRIDGFTTTGLVDGAPSDTTPAYDGTTATWTWTTPETENGMKMNPQAGETIYIKEVPAGSYLKQMLKFTYNSDSGKIGSAWLITNADDTNYGDIGFDVYNTAKTLNPLVGEKATSLSITAVNTNNTQDFKVSSELTDVTGKALFTAGKLMSYKLVYVNATALRGLGKTYDTLPGDNLLDANYHVVNYWITPDGLKVTGTTNRTYTQVLNAYSSDRPSDETVVSVITDPNAT